MNYENKYQGENECLVAVELDSHLMYVSIDFLTFQLSNSKIVLYLVKRVRKEEVRSRTLLAPRGLLSNTKMGLNSQKGCEWRK